MSSPSLHTESVAADTADEINWAKVVAVAVAALVGFTISIIFASAILSSVTASRRAKLGVAETPSLPGLEVGIVNQRPFVLDPRAAITRDAQLKYLHSYGWADRQQKTIHIPIEKAMEMYLAQQQGAGQQK